MTASDTRTPGQYEEIGAAVGRLVDAKQRAYGRSFDKVGGILRVMYPSGIKPEQYDDLGGTIRILDKLFRIATSKKAFGEDPWQDIAGYALLMNRDLLDGTGVAQTGQDPAPKVAVDRKTFLAPFEE